MTDPSALLAIQDPQEPTGPTVLLDLRARPGRWALRVETDPLALPDLLDYLAQWGPLARVVPPDRPAQQDRPDRPA